MSIVQFKEDAGIKVWPGSPHSHGSSPGAAAYEFDQLNIEIAAAITQYLTQFNFGTQQLSVTYECGSKTVTLSGTVPDEDSRERAVFCCGNIQSVARVDDQLKVQP